MKYGGPRPRKDAAGKESPESPLPLATELRLPPTLRRHSCGQLRGCGVARGEYCGFFSMLGLTQLSNYLANFEGLVLGCIEVKVCKKICVGKLLPRSTKCTPLHRSCGIHLVEEIYVSLSSILFENR